MALAGVLLVAPGMTSDIYALLLLIPVMAHQLFFWQARIAKPCARAALDLPE